MKIFQTLRAALIALAVLLPAAAIAQPSNSGPWMLNGASIYPKDNSMGVTLPSTVAGGNKGAGSANFGSLYIGGIPAASSALPSGQIWIGSAGNVATAQTPSGDCTVSIGGVFTCASTSVSNLAALKALVARPSAVTMTGYATAGDGGGGTFVWVASSAVTANDGTVVAPTSGPAGRWMRVWSGPVNVQWFGAKCDGSTNDAAAITAALAIALDVLLPDKICVISSMLTVTSQGLFGSGPNSILRASASTFNLVHIVGAGVRIQNIWFQGAATDSTNGQAAIETNTPSGTQPSGFEISSNRFGGPSSGQSLNNGISLAGNGENNFRIFGNHFEYLIGTISGRGYGVLMGAVRDGVITSNTFQGIRGTHGRHAIYMSAGASNVVASSNTADSFNYEAISVFASTPQPANTNLVIDANVITNSGTDNGNDASIWVGGIGVNIAVTNNTVTGSFGNGIMMDNGAAGNTMTGLVIDGNTVLNSNYYGILTLGPVDQKIRKNYVKGSSQKAAQTYQDIFLAATGTSGVTTVPSYTLVATNQTIGVSGTSRGSLAVGGSITGTVLKFYANDFPITNYLSGASYGTLTNTVWIDGRLQAAISYNYPSTGPGATTPYSTTTILGAHVGDTVIVSHEQTGTYWSNYGTVSATDTIAFWGMNQTATTVDPPNGVLRIDVFQRDGDGL